MQVGRLNRLVTIKRRTAGQGPLGQPLDTWVDVASVWANVRNRTGSQAIRADKDTSVVQTSIRIRRRTDVTAAMRLHMGATVYEVEAVLPDEESRERVDLVCRVIA